MDQGDRKRIKGNRIYLKAEGEQTFKKEEVVNIVKYHNQIQRMRKAKKKRHWIWEIGFFTVDL